jgi:translocation and assembly module TamB
MAGHSDFMARLGANVEVSGRIGHTLREDSFADVRVDNGSFDFLLCAVNRRVCADPSLSFLATGEAKLKWKGGAWQAMSGAGKVEGFELSKSGYHLKTPAAVGVSVQNGYVQLERTSLQGERSKLSFGAEGRVDGSALNASIQGEASMRLLEFFTALMEETRGKMAINLGLSGNISDAKFNGNIDIQEGFLRLAGIDAPVDGLNGRVHFQNSRASVDSLAGQLGGGTVQASGVIDLYLNRPPRFDLDLFFANNRVKFQPVTYAEIGDAKLSLTGERPPYLFGGTARMRRVMMRNNFDVSSRKTLQNARYLPEKQGGAKSLYEIRIRAIAESGVFVENNLLNAEFKGEVTLLNNFEFPQIVARAELVRGKFLFRNTAFTLDHAYIRAPTPEYFNPQFSIGGVATVDNYRISLFASGTIEKPKISLTSYPAIPQEDIVSLLAFGYRGEDARRVKTDNTSAITYSEVGSILLEQLQLNQNLQSKGMRVMVAPSLNETEANIIRPNSSQTASPKVILQTQIMKNLDAVFGGTVGSTQGQSLDAKLEYRLGRKASVSAVYEQTPAGLDATETKNSYGADLKFRWGFK